jgi:hypothetical protein
MLRRKALILLTVLAIGLSGFAPMARAVGHLCASCQSACENGCRGAQQPLKSCQAQACSNVAQPGVHAIPDVPRHYLAAAGYGRNPELPFSSLSSPPRLAPPRR